MSKSLTVSVLVPCAATHLHLVPGLITRLARQTVIPDEVVVAVSSATDSPPRLEATRFPVRFICKADPAFPGENRNRAAKASTCSVLVYNDADDLPHCQRIEIIKELFQHGRVDHLMHGFLHLKHKQSFETWDRSRFSRADYLQRLIFRGYVFDRIHHNGNIATSRRVFDRVAWDPSLRRAEDVRYNRAVNEMFSSTMATLDAPLLVYRQYLSSTKVTVA